MRVTEKDFTVRKPIFIDRYIVRVPAMALRQKFELDVFGTRTTGNEELDKSLLTAPSLAGLTINEMVMHYDNKFLISVPSEKTAFVMFKAIEEYFVAWKRAIGGLKSLNKVSYPKKDLRLLSNFCDSLHVSMMNRAPHLMATIIDEADPDNMFPVLATLNGFKERSTPGYSGGMTDLLRRDK